MRSRLLALLFGSLGLFLLVAPLFSQFPAPDGGGKGGFGKGGFGGGKGGFGGPGGFTAILLQHPEDTFDKFLAKGRDHFLISETRSLREPLTSYAKEKGITDDKITKSQFVAFAQWQKAKTAAAPTTTPGQAPDKPGEAKEGESMEQRIAFEFKRRDTNGDNLLNMDEMSESLRSNLKEWDKNGDNLISLDEFRPYMSARMQERPREAPSDPANIVIIEEDLDQRPVVFRAGKLPASLPAWFKEYDVDTDGQVCLAEWRSQGKKLDEFQDMDYNDDGLLTPQEVLRFQGIATSTVGKTVDDVNVTVYGSKERTTSKGGFSRGGPGGGGFGRGGFGGFGGGKSSGGFGGFGKKGKREP